MNAVPFLLMLHIDNKKMIPDVRKDTAGEEYIYIFEKLRRYKKCFFFFFFFKVYKTRVI